MKMNKIDMNGFYLDVARYTFNYLFETRRKSFVISLQTKKEMKAMKLLLKNCFYQRGIFTKSYVELKMFELGVKGEYVDECKSITFDEYKEILSRYAKSEDFTISSYTRKKLFQDNLNGGFEEILK